MRRLALGLRLLTVSLVPSLVLVGCGGEESAPPQDAAPDSGGSVGTAPGRGEFSVTHILIAWKGAMRSKAERSKEAAKELADSLLRDLQAGRSFNELWLKFTDEPKPPDAKEPTPMSVPETGPSNFVPKFTEGARAVKPGSVSATPIETEFGYHLIRRAP